MKIKKAITLILLIILASAYIYLDDKDQNNPKEEKNIPEDKKSSLKILFCPDEPCENELISLLKSANSSIHCAIYDLKLEKIIEILKEKEKSNIDLKLILEKHNYKGQINGSFIKFDTNSNYMHNKFCIIDKKIVWTGSMNPTDRGAYQNNNNMLILKSEAFTKNYEDEFSEMWNGKYKGGEKVKNPEIMLNNTIIENYFCPEDECQKNAIEEIKKANKSLYFMTFSFTDEKIADEILFLDKNITIKGIFETTQAGSKYSQYKRLKEFGLDVIKDKNKATMHHKVFIIDAKTVITGSYNPTGSGNLRNDENMIIIHNEKIAEEYIKEFEKIWSLT